MTSARTHTLTSTSRIRILLPLNVNKKNFFFLFFPFLLFGHGPHRLEDTRATHHFSTRTKDQRKMRISNKKYKYCMSKLQYLIPAKNEYSYFIKNIFLEIAWYPLRQVQTLPPPYPKHLFFSLFIFWRTTERRRKFKTPIFSSHLPTLHDLPACLHSPTKGWLTAEIAATTHAYYAHVHFGKIKFNSKPFFEMLKSRTGKMAPFAISQTRFLLFPLLLICVFLPQTPISHLCDLILSGRDCAMEEKLKEAKLKVCNTTVCTKKINTCHDKK